MTRRMAPNTVCHALKYIIAFAQGTSHRSTFLVEITALTYVRVSVARPSCQSPGCRPFSRARLICDTGKKLLLVLSNDTRQAATLALLGGGLSSSPSAVRAPPMRYRASSDEACEPATPLGAKGQVNTCSCSVVVQTSTSISSAHVHIQYHVHVQGWLHQGWLPPA